jgi:hypothetical protein
MAAAERHQPKWPPMVMLSSGKAAAPHECELFHCCCLNQGGKPSVEFVRMEHAGVLIILKLQQQLCRVLTDYPRVVASGVARWATGLPESPLPWMYLTTRQRAGQGRPGVPDVQDDPIYPGDHHYHTDPDETQDRAQFLGSHGDRRMFEPLRQHPGLRNAKGRLPRS